jgi:hypothetical protein
LTWTLLIWTAHFGCNARKNTGGSQQLALIG